MGGGAVRCGPPRCALLLDGHDSPPSGYPLAQAANRHCGTRGAATSACSSGGPADQARRDSGLLQLLARAGGRHRDRPGAARSGPVPHPSADRGGRSLRSQRMAHGRRRPAHAPLPSAGPRFAHGRPGRVLRGPSAKDLKGLSAVGRCPTLRYVAVRGLESPARRGVRASMSRVSVAEGTKLSVVVARGLIGRLTSRVATHPIVNWPFSFAKTDRIVIAPQDLRTSDATRAGEIYAGRFAFTGKVVTCDSRSPFEITPPTDEWAAALLGFGWLRHLRAAESGISRANARALVDEWITVSGSHDPVGWRADVVARRIMSWLSQAPLLLDGAHVQFYRRFLRGLTRQVRHLRRTASQARDGVPRLQAVIALCYAALCMARQQRHIRAATNRLSDELARQILPDGGHISRNPGALIESLLDLLPLRSAFTARNLVPPPALLNAIDRMMPMLRFFRHGDGNFALFNGMGPTSTDLLTTVLAYDDARGAPLANAPHSGYQRLESAGTLVLMDAGRPPPMAVSQEAHAGCLSFELSTKQNRIVVNCGLPVAGREGWRQVARTTAAHSTVTFNDTSSCRFIEAGPIKRMLYGTPMIAGPREVAVAREEQADAVILRTSHDGYADIFNVIQQRVLMLDDDGRRLDGEDQYTPARGALIPADRDQFAVRFHLHPSVKANRLADGHSAMLAMPNREVWTFSAYEDRVDVEESVYLAGPDGPRRTVQLVIYGRARNTMRVQRTFCPHAVQGTGPAGPRRGRDNEPQLPL